MRLWECNVIITKFWPNINLTLLTLLKQSNMNLSCGQILKFSLLLKNAAKGSNCHVEPGFTTQSSPTLSHVCGQNS